MTYKFTLQLSVQLCNLIYIIVQLYLNSSNDWDSTMSDDKLFQSLIADGKKECLYASILVGN